VRDYLRLRIGALEHEVFLALLLDSQAPVLKTIELFAARWSQTSVYPREVVKAALAANAAAVIFAHNSSVRVAQPSQADEHSDAAAGEAAGAGRNQGARPLHTVAGNHAFRSPSGGSCSYRPGCFSRTIRPFSHSGVWPCHESAT
jgi:hypothetical protein